MARYKIMAVTLVVTGVVTLVCNRVETYASLVGLAVVLGLIGEKLMFTAETEPADTKTFLQ